jgi:hypothetical protein
VADIKRTIDYSVTDYEPQQAVLVYPFPNAYIEAPADGVPCKPCDCFPTQKAKVNKPDWAGKDSLPPKANDAAHARGKNTKSNGVEKDYIGFGDPQDHEWAILFPDDIDGGLI